jgi:capsular polysaccharide biosynthesis protein
LQRDESRAPSGPRESIGARIVDDAVRYWPLVLLVALAAVAATLVALSRRDPSYRATATVLITPLPQYDDAFLGVSLVRDAGDANRTAATVAALIDSDDAAAQAARTLGVGWTTQSVKDAVAVKPIADTNVVRITADAGDRARAELLASTYVRSAFQVRWRRIARELDARISDLEGLRRAAAPTGGEVERQLAILEAVRRGGADPTLSHRRTDRAEEVSGVPSGVAVVLAVLGGLVVGVLAAATLGALRRRLGSVDESQAEEEPAVAPDGFTAG